MNADTSESNTAGTTTKAGMLPDVPIGTRELRVLDDAAGEFYGEPDFAEAKEILLRLYRFAYWEGVAQTLRQHADHDRHLIAAERERIRQRWPVVTEAISWRDVNPDALLADLLDGDGG